MNDQRDPRFRIFPGFVKERAFVWHKHEDTADFFVVLKGRVTIQMQDGNVTLGPGEMFVVPKGVEHCPIA